MAKKPKVQFFTTVTDMRAVPLEKIEHFCEDLRLWLSMHKHIELAKQELGELSSALRITSPEDRFGWLDDDKHDANINITIRQELEPAQPVAAVPE